MNVKFHTPLTKLLQSSHQLHKQLPLRLTLKYKYYLWQYSLNMTVGQGKRIKTSQHSLEL